MDQAKKQLSQILLLLAVIMGGIVIFQWLLVNELYSPDTAVLLRLEKVLRKALMVRFIYVIVIAGLAFLFPVPTSTRMNPLKGHTLPLPYYWPRCW